MEKHDRYLYFHLGMFGILFIILLTSSISNTWSVSTTGYKGLFIECHHVHFCEKNDSGVDDVMQMVSILSCVITMLSEIYCFCALLIHKYVQSKLYVLSITYFICACLSFIECILYSQLLHTPIYGENVSFGWPIYASASTILLSILGTGFALFYYKEEKKEPLLLVESAELYKYRGKPI